MLRLEKTILKKGDQAMRHSLSTLLLGLALGTAAIAAPVQAQAAPALVAFGTPASEHGNLDPTYPEKPIDASSSTWDDTADTSDDLNIVEDQGPDVHLEMDLNNDVHDPLLEDQTVEPVDILPANDPEHYPTRDLEPHNRRHPSPLP
jgi:hypothetical protein